MATAEPAKRPAEATGSPAEPTGNPAEPAMRSAARREGMKAGQDLVAAGYIALSGTAIAAARREKELRGRFTAQFVRRCQNIREAVRLPGEDFFRKAGAAEYEPSGEGGIMKTLWELFAEYGLGFEIELRALPILQETVEVCELFDMNPYRLHSEGCVLLSADNGGALVKFLEQNGIHAAVIGRVESGIKRQIINGEIRSFLDRPRPDELIKIN